VFPAALVEFFASLAIFGVLWWLRTRLRVPGMLTVVYLVLYAVSQFVVFFWRANSITLFDLKQAQLTSIAMLIVCVPLAIYLVRRGERTPLAESNPSPSAALGPTATEETSSVGR
jgi:phosphatidylglycerol:prolipoprotein diacylglycerol transferase